MDNWTNAFKNWKPKIPNFKKLNKPQQGQLQDLKKRVKQLTDKNQRLANQPAPAPVDDKQLQDLKRRVDQLTAALNEKSAAQPTPVDDKQLQDLRGKVTKLTAQNGKLKAQIQQLRNPKQPISAPIHPFAAAIKARSRNPPPNLSSVNQPQASTTPLVGRPPPLPFLGGIARAAEQKTNKPQNGGSLNPRPSGGAKKGGAGGPENVAALAAAKVALRGRDLSDNQRKIERLLYTALPGNRKKYTADDQKYANKISQLIKDPFTVEDVLNKIQLINMLENYAKGKFIINELNKLKLN